MSVSVKYKNHLIKAWLAASKKLIWLNWVAGKKFLGLMDQSYVLDLENVELNWIWNIFHLFCLAPSLWSWWFFIGQMNLCWCIISETWWKQLQWLCWANRTLRENGNVEKYFASISIRQSSIIRCDHCPVSAPAPTLAKTAINKVRNTGLDTSEVFSLHFDRTWIF